MNAALILLNNVGTTVLFYSGIQCQKILPHLTQTLYCYKAIDMTIPSIQYIVYATQMSATYDKLASVSPNTQVILLICI